MSELVITRIFNAPRDLVYRAFVDPDQLSQWFGPVGWSVPRDTVDVDARPGGHQRLTMVNDENPEMSSPVNATFSEVIDNELLVAEEDTSGIPDFPTDRMHLRIEFHDEPEGRTRIVITQGPYTPEMEGMAREGWNSSFTKLDKIFG